MKKMSTKAFGPRVTMKTMPDLMRRLRAGAAQGRMSVTVSGHIPNHDHHGLTGLEAKVVSNAHGMVISCKFQGNLTILIPLTDPWFEPLREGECAAFYRVTAEGIIVTYVMPGDKVGERYFRFGT